MKHALRSLARSPGFTAVAALTLALGIGANTTFFSVLCGVVLRGLPFPDAHELVELRHHGGPLSSNNGAISAAELHDVRDRQRTLVGIGAYDIGRATLHVPDGAERVVETQVTANLLPLLGIAPALGRHFTADEEHAGQNHVVIVSHAFWQNHLGGSPDAIGQTIRLNHVEHTVVGVMPATFFFSFGGIVTAVWKPLDLSGAAASNRDDRSLSTIARLAPGLSVDRARADFRRIARQLQTDLPAAYPPNASWSLELTPLRESQFGQLLAPLAMLMAASAAVLLIAAVNVSIMFLLRAAVRRREMMIRLAIGASRWHIVRQLLAESAAVCVLGALGGLLLAAFGLELLKTFPPADIPRLAEVAIDAPAAAFTIGVLVSVSLLIALAPAAAVLRARVSEDLTRSTRTTDTHGTVRLRDALTVVEIALAVTLLVCGGLAVRSLQHLLRDEIGFNTSELLTFKTNLTGDAYPDLSRTNAFYDQLATRIASLPAVESVAAVSSLPLSGESQFTSVAPSSDPIASPATVAWRATRGPYFSTIGSTLLRGRFFNASDQANSPLVTIVDERFAARFWPDLADAIGQPLRFGSGNDARVRTIVGVVRHVKHAGPGRDSLPEVYVPHEQVYQRGMFTVVKATHSASLAPLIRAELARLDPRVAMYFVETMEHRYASALALPRFTAGLFGAFSALALILAGVGIFGVTAYGVAQRSREFGIRFALGAQRSHVIALVLRRVARLSIIGGILGLLAAQQLGSLMHSLLFGVEPTDTPTLIATAALVAFTALAASLVPLARALHVNPAEALRAE